MQNICNISLSKAIKIFFLNALFFSLSYSSENYIFKYVEVNKIYDKPYWAKLLHYKNGESEVDSDNFFISSIGKKDLKKELSQTIQFLLNGEKNILCRFPLRVQWLTQNIPSLKNSIKKYECKDLNRYLKEISTKNISIIFPSSHINSPASMYGHTFLKVYDKEDTSLISNAINYAAKTQETNGLVFAYQGLFGGYEGRYSILPYYKKIKEYSSLEQRDVWEYKLSFNEDEIKKIVLHTYELINSFSYYYFFLENCSYNLLWMFEIAKPKLDLINKFKIKAIPLDTIKILRDNNLILSSKYRYSKMKKMDYILDKIKNKTYLKDYLKDNVELNKNLSLKEKVNYLDLKLEYLKYQRTKNKIDNKKYLKRYLKLLKQRSGLKKVSSFDVTKPKDPLYSHGSSKMEVFYRSDNKVVFDIKPAYNDIYDVYDGYLKGAFIDFFRIKVIKEKRNILFDKFVLLDIKSYAKRNLLFKPISWGVNLGYERFNNRGKYLHLKPQFGATFSNNQEYLYVMAQSNLYTKFNYTLASIGTNIGVVSDRFDNLKFGINLSYDQYNHNLNNKQLESFFTYKIRDNISLNTKYQYNDLNQKENIFSLGFYFYF